MQRLFPLALVALLLSAAPAASAAKETSFPDSLLGTWTGDLEIFGADGKRKTIGMDLTVARGEKPDRYRWVIGYEGQPKRNYRLVAKDRAKGEYAIDERNSIEIPARYLGGELISVFSVSGNHLVARYRPGPDGLRYEIIMTPTRPASRTGGTEGIPAVSCYEVRTVQRATLRRTSKPR